MFRMSSDANKDIDGNYFCKPIEGNRDKLECLFCHKILNGGAKKHLVGGDRNVTVCPKCPPHVKV